MMSSLFEKMKQYRVEAESVEQFIERYGKGERYKQRGKHYVDASVASHKKRVAENGFTLISSHDSTTGDIVTYYPKTEKAKA